MLGLARRAAAVAAVVMLGVGLVACGSDDGDAASSEGAAGSGEASAALEEATARVDEYLSNPPLELEPLSATPAEGLRVVSVNCTLAACKPGEFERATTALGWDASEETYDLAKGPSDFVAAVRRALQSEPDALAILFVYPPDLIEEELTQARDQGVTLVDIGSAIDSPPDGFIACIACGPHLHEAGKAEADFVAVDAGGPTEVGVVGDKTIDANIATTEALVAEFEQVSPDTEVHLIEASFAQTPQANAQAVVSALQRNPGIEYLMFQSESLMGGVDQALSAAGLADKVKVVGIDPSDEATVELVDGGGVYAWLGIDGPVIWWRAVDAIARAEVGDDVDPTPLPQFRVINEDNVQPEMLAPPDYESTFEQAWGVA